MVNKLGLNPPPMRFRAALIDSFAELGDQEEAICIWNELSSFVSTPDGEAYRAVVAALSAVGRDTDAMERFEELDRLVRQGKLSIEDLNTVSVYNSVLQHLVKTSQSQEVDGFFQCMRVSGPTSDTTSYNIMLGYYMANGNDIGPMVQDMREPGILCDFDTFAIILPTYVPNQHNAILFVLAKMKQREMLTTSAACHELMTQRLL
jgi:hypothetical protein